MAELIALARLLMGAPPGPDLDWDALVDLAQRHEVVPLLFWKLAKERPPGRTPGAILETLQSYFYAAAVRATIVEQELAQVLEALTAAAVPALVVKGAAAALFYADPALRTYADLDILVPQALLDQACRRGLRDGLTPPAGKLPGLHHYRSSEALKPGPIGRDSRRVRGNAGFHFFKTGLQSPAASLRY